MLHWAKHVSAHMLSHGNFSGLFKILRPFYLKTSKSNKICYVVPTQKLTKGVHYCFPMQKEDALAGFADVS